MNASTASKLLDLEYRLVSAIGDLAGLRRDLAALAADAPAAGHAANAVRKLRRRLERVLCSLDDPIGDAVQAALIEPPPF